MSRKAPRPPTIGMMSSQRGLSALEALAGVAILVVAAVVLYPLVRSAVESSAGARTGVAVAVKGAAAEAPSDRLPMLAYIESAAEGRFFLFRRFPWSVMSRSYLEDVGVYARSSGQGAYKDPFEGVYLWAMSPNTGIEFLNPKDDPYRMPPSADEVVALFDNRAGSYYPETPDGFGGFGGFAGGAQSFAFGQPTQPSGFGQPALPVQPGITQPGIAEPGIGGSDPLGQPGTFGNKQPGYPLGAGLDF